MNKKENITANLKPINKVFLGRVSGAQIDLFGQTTLNK
jgi:hypothetical protein